MVFTLAIVFASSAQAPTAAKGHGLLVGAVLGLAVALAIAYAIFKLGKRLNLGLFFRIVGIVLMVFAAGLLADAVENMQELGWLPFWDHVLWNTSTFLSEDSPSVTSSTACWATPTTRPCCSSSSGPATWACATTAFIVLGRRQRRVAAAGGHPPMERRPSRSPRTARRPRPRCPPPSAGDAGPLLARPPAAAGLSPARRRGATVDGGARATGARPTDWTP